MTIVRRRGHPMVGCFVGLFMMAGGLVFLGLGAWMAYRSVGFSIGTEEAIGHVADWHISHTRKRHTNYRPVVRYLVDGKVFTLTAKSGLGRQYYSLGDAVTVLYYPDRPEEAQLNGFSERWLGPLMAGVFGALSTASAALLTWTSFRDWKKRTSNFVPMVTT